MPAVSGSPTQNVTSVATALDLAGTPDEAFSEGDLACVRALWPQSTFRLRRTSLSYGVVPNNVTEIATYSGNGYWELFPQGGSMLSFPNIASLAAFDDQNLADGALVYVQSVRSYWSKVIEPNPGSLDGITAVRDPSDTATWYREPIASPSWQELKSWAIAASTGDDENLGDTGSPLKTWAEFARRVQTIANAVAVNIVETTTEVFYGTFAGVGDDAVLSIIGAATTVAVGSAGMFVDPVTGPTAASAAMGTVTATGLDFSTAHGALGNFVVAGKSMAPLLGNVGAAGIVPFWSNPSGNLAKPLDGIQVRVITPRSIGGVCLNTANLDVGLTSLRLTTINTAVSHHVIVSPDKRAIFYACHHDGYFYSYGNLTLISHLVNGGATLTGNSGIAYYLNSGTLRLIGGGSRRNGNIFVFGGGAAVSYKGHLVNGGSMIFGTVISGYGGVVTNTCNIHLEAPYGLGVFNAPLTSGFTGAGVSLPSANIMTGSVLYGTGNANYGLDIGHGSRAQFDAGYTPAITGNANDFRFETDTVIALPPLVAGLPVPANQSIAGINGAGWAKWDGSSGGYFNRQLLSYNNGTALCAG